MKLFKALKVAVAAAGTMLALSLFITPVKAEEVPGGPWGDIQGWYQWRINAKGQTIYSQNGVSWIYDAYGNRTYLDVHDNPIYNITPAKASTIAQMQLTYYTTDNGVDVYAAPSGVLYTIDDYGHVYQYGQSGGGGGSSEHVNDYTMYYSFTTPDGYNIYGDDYGNCWWFGAGGTPNRYYGGSENSYWRTDVHNYVYRYQYKTADGYYIYRDDYGNLWWFGAGGEPHRYNGAGAGAGTGSAAPGASTGAAAPAASNKPAETNVDWSMINYMEADGVRTAKYVGQYWQAPTTISWRPEGTRLVGWDWAEDTGYVRWAPGAWILNTGSDLYLYPVFR